MRLFRHILLPCLIVLGAACATQEYHPPVAVNISLAVAAFTQPQSINELLAGYIPEGQQSVSKDTLRSLDTMLDQVLKEQTSRSYIPANSAIGCQKLPSEPLQGKSALEYWVQVGECLKVDYLLAPTLLYWQERLGTDVGATQPAAVTMDIFVIDVAGKVLHSRGHFEETQRPLSENLLDAPAFFTRGARWITAEELAREGLAQIVKELGL